MDYVIIGTMEGGSADGIVDGFHEAIDGNKAVLFTSDRPNVGKSTVLLALSESLGKAGDKVLAVDADLRAENPWPSEYGLVPHRYNQKGFLDEVYHGDYFDVVYAAMVGKRPEYVYTSKQFETLMEQAREIYDVILVDAASANLFDDAKLLSERTDVCVAVWNPNDGDLKHLPVDIIGVISNPFDRTKGDK